MIGMKRKREELEEDCQAKKQKLGSSSQEEIIQIIPEIPQDCWNNIISFIPFDSFVVAIFVSKKWRQFYCRMLDQKISRSLSTLGFFKCFIMLKY